MKIKNHTLHSYIHSGVFQTLNKTKINKRSKSKSKSKTKRTKNKSKRFRIY